MAGGGLVCLKFRKNLKITANTAEKNKINRFYFLKMQVRIINKCRLVKSGVLQEAHTLTPFS